jgi:hypothetical protein
VPDVSSAADSISCRKIAISFEGIRELEKVAADVEEISRKFGAFGTVTEKVRTI